MLVVQLDIKKVRCSGATRVAANTFACGLHICSLVSEKDDMVDDAERGPSVRRREMFRTWSTSERTKLGRPHGSHVT